MAKSGLAGRGMRQLVEQATARYQGVKAQEAQMYEDALARLKAKQAEQATPTPGATQSQQETGAGKGPVYDPNSEFGKYLREIGKTVQDYEKMSVLQRQKEIVDPLLEKQWLRELAANPQLAQASNDQLDRYKEQYFTERRNVYDANFKALEDKETILGKIGNFLSDVGEGANDLIAAGGDILKPVFGNDNFVSQGIDTATDTVRSFLHESQTKAEQQREEYFNQLMHDGEFAKAGKLFAENPTMVLGEVGKLAGGVGGYGKAVKLGAKAAGAVTKGLGAAETAAKIVEKGTKLSRSMPLYSGIQSGGQIAQELHTRKIDTDTVEGRMAVLAGALGSAMFTKITPHNAENSITKFLTGKGVSPSVAGKVSTDMVKALRADGVFNYAKNLGKNAIKGGLNEGFEETGQTGLEALFGSLLIGKDGKFRNWDEISDAEKKAAANRAIGGGLLGFTLGSAVKVGHNALNRHGDIDVAREQAQQAAINAQFRKQRDNVINERTKESSEVAEEVRRDEEEARQAEEAKQADETKRSQALADLEAYLARAEDEQARIAEYGKYAPKAKENFDNARTVVDLQNDIDDVASRVFADSNDASIARAKTVYDNQSPADRIDTLIKMAQVTGDVDLQTEIAQKSEKWREQLKHPAFKDRFRGPDGMILTENERSQLAEVVSFLTGKNVNPNEVGIEIDNLNLDNSAYAEAGKALKQVRQDNNGFVVGDIHADLRNNHNLASKLQPTVVPNVTNPKGKNPKGKNQKAEKGKGATRTSNPSVSTEVQELQIPRWEDAVSDTETQINPDQQGDGSTTSSETRQVARPGTKLKQQNIGTGDGTGVITESLKSWLKDVEKEGDNTIGQLTLMSFDYSDPHFLARRMHEWIEGLYNHRADGKLKVIEEMLHNFDIVPRGQSVESYIADLNEAGRLGHIQRVRDKLSNFINEMDVHRASEEPISLPDYLTAIALRNTLNYAIAEAETTPSTNTSASKANRALRSDSINGTLGAVLRESLRTGSLASALESAEAFFKSGELGRRVLNRIKQIAIDNDVHIDLMTREEMDATFGKHTNGAYDNETSRIYIADDLSFNETVHTLVHEATHAYLNRKAFALHNFNVAKAANPDVTPAEYGLTKQDLQLLTEMDTLMREVHSHENFNSSRYNLNRVTLEDGTVVPYVFSHDINSPHALAEFAAELFSDESFRRAVADTHSKLNETSYKTAWQRIKNFFKQIAQLWGFSTNNDVNAVEQFIDNGMALLDTVPYRMAGNGVSRLSNTTEAVNGFATDMKIGVQSYTFKRPGQPDNGVASAVLDRESGRWDFQWVDENGQWHSKEALTNEQLLQEVSDQGLKVLSRNGKTHANQNLMQQVDRVYLTHPAVAKGLLQLHGFISNFSSVENADMVLDKAINFVLWFEHTALDRDALSTWAARMINHRYQDATPEERARLAADFKNDLAVLRAEYNNELIESGVNQKSFYDYRNAIVDIANKFGVSEKRLEAITYALAARQRAIDFAANPGGIDPYTGKPYRSLDHVSGFRHKNGVVDKNGELDETGGKLLNSLTAQERQFVQEFSSTWIAMNNHVLDVEYASGVLSRDQYIAQYNKFYAPLRNEYDEASAFYKGARGRHSVAKDPFTNYFAHADRRIKWALRQREMSILLDATQDHSLGNIFQVNLAYRVGKGDGTTGQQWRTPNRSDGTTFVIYKNGQPFSLTVTDPGVQKILRRAKSWEERSQFWVTMSKITRGLSSTKTWLSPVFIPTAYARDLLTSMVNIQAAFRNMKGVQTLSDGDAARMSVSVPARAVKSVWSILKGKWTGNRGWEYDVFKRMGGGIVMNASMDFEEHNSFFKDNLLKVGRTPLQIVGGKARAGLGKIADISHAAEDSVRFATFMEYLELRAGRKFTSAEDLIAFTNAHPEWKREAIAGSKNVTSNFEVKGNSIAMRSMFMFFNAGMQGANTAVHMFDPSHGTHAVKAMGIIAGLALASLASVDAELGDDEDGKSKAHRVNLTENALCAGMAGCVQLPHEVRWISAGMKAMYHYGKGDIDLGDGLAMFMRGVAQAGVPLNFGNVAGDNPGASLLMGLTPTILSLPVQLVSNTNSFGNDITPEFAYTSDGQRILNAQDWQKTRASDSDLSKWVALNGRKYLGVDWSSSQIDHTLQFMLGGIFSAAKKIGRGVEAGDDASQILSKVFANGFIPKYDEFALARETKAKLNDLKATLSLGDSIHQMVVGRKELQSDPRYTKLIALEKAYEKRVKAGVFNGKSMSQLMRQKESAILNDDYDAIIEANEGIDVIREYRSEVEGDFLRELYELEDEIK